jgi:hypothetical protein
MVTRLRRRRLGWTALVATGSLALSSSVFAVVAQAQSTAATVAPHAVGALDCNMMSPIQKPITGAKACTDIKGMLGVDNKNTWGGKFYDNGRYIGHDEPFIRFLSPTPGSGNNVTFNETLGMDPLGSPTVNHPGSDRSKYAELTIAPWFGMALCNPFSYPQLPCRPKSDKNAPVSPNAPTPPGQYPGAGSSFLEMQFYPPGQGPFIDNISCDNTHWCASLHINDAECTVNFGVCNVNCEEPTNFAFIQTNGVPTGPPSPQLSDVATNTPNSNTLLMNPGDNLRIHMWDAPVPGKAGQFALETSIRDLTTGQSGFMQASAANGFMATDMTSCGGIPFNYEPEYSTAAVNNIVPWAADQLTVGTQFEIGHFEPCNSLTQPFSVNLVIGGYTDVTYNKCHGVYENTAPGGDGGGSAEPGDAFCYPKGDTHFGQSPPNTVTGCLDDVFQNGDLDFDGSGYWTEWPTSTVPNLYPSTFLQSFPTSVGGNRYPQFQFQTDAALSESTCMFPDTTGCVVPPPNAPGMFYPHWTLTKACQFEFGNMSNGNSYGKTKQYGRARVRVGYPQLFGPILTNPC